MEPECAKIKNELIAYYYKELDQEKELQVKAHLDRCNTCSLAYEEIEKTLRLINQKATFEPPEEFWNGYLDKVYDKVDRGSLLNRIFFAVKCRNCPSDPDCPKKCRRTSRLDV